MIGILQDAFRAAAELPMHEQEAIARFVLDLADGAEPAVRLTREEEAAIAASEDAEARNDYATDDEVRAIWAKHGL